MRNIKIVLPTLLLAASLLLSACGATGTSGAMAALPLQGATPETYAAGSTAPDRTIAVTGTGKVTLTPDIAYISIGVHTEHKDAKTAVNSNNTQSADLITALKKAGVDAKDIRTTNFSIYPRQNYDNNGQVTGITYIVDNTVYVTVRNLDSIGALLNAAVEAGANSIGGIQFDVADRTAAYQEALKAAVSDARAQADVLASAAGVSVGEVQQINASVGYTQPPMPMARGGAEMALAADVPISAGQMEVTVTVNVVYGIK
ncbi:MAG: SIMPL domain-containing protein [Anaerolineae bacterium]|nr:MAG: SIMPL domain-containing protein [Anaerolineae bacterium]